MFWINTKRTTEKKARNLTLVFTNDSTCTKKMVSFTFVPTTLLSVLTDIRYFADRLFNKSFSVSLLVNESNNS